MVALESTVFSRLGLPDPAGRQALSRSLDALAGGGAVAALAVVLDGIARIGVDDSEFGRVFAADRKVGERDVAVAVAQGWTAAATTVSASVALAAAAGVTVFATGGIGGVHRHWSETGDESADLLALARHPVVTVCAGAKSFLDLPRTLERLETLGVPVLGLDTAAVSSPLSGPAAAVWRSRRRWFRRPRSRPWSGPPGPWATAAASSSSTPVPEGDEIPLEELAPVIDAALTEAAVTGVTGGAVTPFVLNRIAAATGGRTVAANLALLEHNSSVAAAIAAALAGEPASGPPGTGP